MKMIVLRCLILVSLVFFAAGSHTIRKRSLSHFGEMIQFLTEKDSLDFNAYGRWCGFGGSGTPVDGIDRCCQQHDHCYDRANRDKCTSWMINRSYLTKYKWHVDGMNITCEDDRPCEQATCLCDRQGAMCFRDHIDEYDRDNQSLLGKFLHDIITG